MTALIEARGLAKAYPLARTLAARITRTPAPRYGG